MGSTESRLSGFSNRGLGVIDVAAPGSRILSTIVKDNGYGTKSGTSMASPHVAGVLALMVSAHPNWSPAQLVSALRAQADDKPCGPATAGAVCVGPAEDNSYFGDGVVPDPGNWFDIDEIVISDQHIGPPEGFVR